MVLLVEPRYKMHARHNPVLGVPYKMVYKVDVTGVQGYLWWTYGYYLGDTSIYPDIIPFMFEPKHRVSKFRKLFPNPLQRLAARVKCGNAAA